MQFICCSVTHRGECPQCEKILLAYPDFECVCCSCSFSNFMCVHVYARISVCVYTMYVYVLCMYVTEIPVIDFDT